MFYAEDIESIYVDGSTNNSEDIQAEKCLIANVIQQALSDVTLVYTSKTTGDICKCNTAIEAYEWLHDTETEVGVPFSFRWCCNILYPTYANTVINKIRALSDKPDLKQHLRYLGGKRHCRRISLSMLCKHRDDNEKR